MQDRCVLGAVPRLRSLCAKRELRRFRAPIAPVTHRATPMEYSVNYFDGDIRLIRE